MDGDTLGMIRYHEGFLGQVTYCLLHILQPEKLTSRPLDIQRIGPVSCLAFHPHKLYLAAGATDSIVSVYSHHDK